jgi:hypothetical protein
MIIELIGAALRRRPFSVICTVALIAVSASLLSVPLAIAVTAWAVGVLLGLELWLALERPVLRLLGCRAPTPREREQLEIGHTPTSIAILVVDDCATWIGTAVRTVVIARGALEVLDEQGLRGLLAHAETQRRSMWIIRAGLVWLGNAPVLWAWWLGRGLGLMGRLLALVIGSALVVPVLLWPAGFVRWVGRALGALFVAYVGALLVAGGVTPLGLGLLAAWAVVPALRTLLAWEARAIEADADAAVVKAGLGGYLSDAIEQLELVEAAAPTGMLGWLVVPGTPRTRRLNRLARQIEDA